MLKRFDIEAEFNSSNIFPWANEICREFLYELGEAVKLHGYKINIQGDDGVGRTRETICTEAEFNAMKRVFFCDFQIEDEHGLTSMWYRLQLNSSKAICGVINLLTISKITTRDFRNLVINNHGRTDFLSYYLVQKLTELGKLPAPKKQKAVFKSNPVYHFKVFVNSDCIIVWCAVDEDANKPDKEGFARLYANVFSCIKLSNITLAVSPIFMCNGCVPGTLKACTVNNPLTATNARQNHIQLGRILTVATYPNVYEWTNKYLILIPNFTDYTIGNFELSFDTYFQVLSAERFLLKEKIATFGYLDSVSDTKKQLVAFINDWE